MFIILRVPMHIFFQSESLAQAGFQCWTVKNDLQLLILHSPPLEFWDMKYIFTWSQSLTSVVCLHHCTVCFLTHGFTFQFDSSINLSVISLQISQALWLYIYILSSFYISAGDWSTHHLHSQCAITEWVKISQYSLLK